MKKCWKKGVTALFCLSLLSAGCGGGGGNDGGGSDPSLSANPDSWKAVALAGSNSSNSASGGSVGRTQKKSLDDLEETKDSLLSYISDRLAEYLLRDKSPGAEKKVSLDIQGNVATFTFENETFEEDGGTITINGTFTDTEKTKTEGTLAGNLTADIKDASEKVKVGGNEYTEVVNGRVTIEIYGTYNASNGAELDLTTNIKTKDLRITGSVAGTVNDMDVTAKLYYKFNFEEQPVITFTCGGHVTASTDNGFSGTCNLAETCDGCI